MATDPSSVRIPDATLLEGLLAMVSAAFGWLLRLERRSGRTAQRMSDHEHSCERRQEDLKDHLTKIEHMLERQDEETREHRERINNSIHAIGLKVAVLQTRAGLPPSGDTGTHHRLNEGV